MFNKSKESLLLAKVKRHLADNCEQQRLMALEQALTLGQQGLDLFTQQALQDNSEKIRQSAYWILHQHNPYLCKNSGEISSNKPMFPTDTIACVAISPDNQILVGGSWQKIWVWNLQTGELLRTIDAHFHWVLSVAINRDSNTLVSSSADTTIKLWDLSKGSLIREINAHSNWVNAVEITPDGKTIVSASADKTIKIWDFNTGKLQHTLKNHSGSVLSLAISPDGKVIASGSTDKTVKLWNLQSGKLDRSLEEHLGWVQAIRISQDSRFLISGSRDGDIKILQADFNIQNELKPFDSDDTGLIAKIIGFIFLIVISKVTAGAVFWIGLPFLSLGDLISKKNKQTHTFNISKLKCSHSIHQELTDTVNNLVISHDNKNLISVSNDNAKQWCIETKQLVRTLTGHSGFVSSAAISPDGKILATASNDWIKLWDLHTGQLLHPLKGCAESRLSHISIFPLQVQLECGQCQTFSIKGTDQNGLDISVQELSWQAEGGNIDNSGLFIAGEKEGEFTVTTTAGSFQTSASVTIIEPPKLTQLIITPQEIKLECGKVQTFNIRGLDQQGSEIGVEKLLWQATGGTIDAHGTFHAGQNPGEFVITANLEAVKTSVSVTLIEPAKLQTLIIFPLKPTLTFGESLNFTIKGVDQYGSDIKLEEVTWSATGSTIFPDGRLQATYQEQEITATASVGEISTSTIINVIEPSRLTELVISPQQVVMNPGECEYFEVMGLDQRGDAIAISGVNWKATDGTINQDGYYLTDSNQKGQFTITATIGRSSVCAHVSVPPVLRRLEIFPPQIQLQPEETQTFTVIGFDQQDTEITLEKVNWKSTKGGSISRQGLFQGGYSHRDVTVTASVGNVWQSVYITLLPILRRLQISPSAVQLKPNERQTFTVIGFDQYGDEIDTGEICWEASGGDIDKNGSFIADFNAKGQFLVTATSRLTPKLIKKSRTLLFHIGISSKILSYVLRFLAQLQDEFITESNTEDTSEDSSTVPETKIDNFELELQAWITKTLIKLASRLLGSISSLCLNQATANLSASAEITVVPVLRHLEIYPAKAHLKPYESITFSVKGLDQHCYDLDVNNLTWKATDGNINSDGTLSVDDKCSNVTITATVDAINSFAYVSVVKALLNISRQNSSKTADVKLGKPLDSTIFPSIQKSNHNQNNKFVSNKLLEVTLKEKISKQKFDKLDFDYEDKYECKYGLSSPHNYIDNCHKSCEKSSWFYRSQLYYDGLAINEFSGDYNDYLSYQDKISYIEFLM